MARFAHIADCHLGGWKIPELQDLNFQSFRKAIDICLKERVDFVIFAGDTFDSAYPPIDILKETFYEFRRLKEAKIPVFIIAGSHDSSVSGKTFLDVLERAGFCTNLEKYDVKDDKIILYPTIYGDIAFYGYPGKRAGLEVQDLRKVKFQDSPGLFKIFVLHTTTTKVKGNLPIESIDEDDLPKANYYALGHIHVVFQYENFVYTGPLYPNNFQELEDLHHGGFFIVNTNRSGRFTIERRDVPIKKVEVFEIDVDNGITATDKIISELNKRELEDKIVLLRVRGILKEGKNSDIKFSQIEDFISKKKAFCLLKNTNDLRSYEVEFSMKSNESENVEGDTIFRYTSENPSDFNKMIPDLMNALSLEKLEDEKSLFFEKRLLDEVKKIVKI